MLLHTAQTMPFEVRIANAMDKFTKGWARWVPAVVLMGAIYCLSSLPSAEVPHFGLVDFLVKKGGHLLGYALLALAFSYGLDGKSASQYRLAFLLAVLYALGDEFHQSFVPGRQASPYDVGIDALGAALALWIYARRRTKR